MSDPWSSARGYGGNPTVLRRRLAALYRAGKRSGCSPAGCMTRGFPTPGWSNPSRGPPRSARLVAVSPWASVQQATLLEGIRIRGEPSTGPDRMLGHTGPCSDQHRGHGYSEFFYDIFDFRSFTVWAAIGKMVETFAAGAFWVRTVTGTPSDVLAFAFMFSFLDIRFSLRYRNWQGLYNGSGPNALGRAGPQTLSTRCSAESQAAALEALDADCYASSSAPAVKARRECVRQLLSQWQLTPFPITAWKLRALGVSLKAGHYRSHASVVSQYKVDAERRGQPVDGVLCRIIADINRSCRRGLGPPVRALALPFDRLDELPGGMQPWCEHGPVGSRNCMVVGSWWLFGGSKPAL